MLTVSNYHYIRHDFGAPYPSIFGLTPDQFSLQLDLLGHTGSFVTPVDLMAHTDDILKSSENYILVTFDDGLKEQFLSAKPILDSRGIRALYFVNSSNFMECKVSLVHKIHLLRSVLAPEALLSALDRVVAGRKLNDAEKSRAEQHYNYDDAAGAHFKFLLNFRLSATEQATFADALFGDYFNESETVSALYLTEGQLRQLAAERSLGSHTHSHLALGLYPAKVIEAELTKTKDFLNSFGDDAAFVSYPYGNAAACATPVPELARKVGHSFGFTVERGINTGKEDRMLLKRFDCNDLPGGKNYHQEHD